MTAAVAILAAALPVATAAVAQTGTIKPPSQPTGIFNPKEFKLDQKPPLPSSTTPDSDALQNKKVPAKPK